MGIGFAICVLCFVFSYSRVPVAERIWRRGSKVMRSFDQRMCLAQQQSQIVLLALHGYIFFGSGTQLLKRVRQQIIIKDDKVTVRRSGPPDGTNGSDVRQRGGRGGASSAVEGKYEGGGRDGGDGGEGGGGGGGGAAMAASPVAPPVLLRRLTSLQGTHDPHDPSNTATSGGSTGGSSGGVHGHSGGGGLHSPQSQQCTRFVVLDMTRVTGLDATATASCFGTLKQQLARHDIVLVLAGMFIRIYVICIYGTVLSLYRAIVGPNLGIGIGIQM